jgi:hypothetical protein
MSAAATSLRCAAGARAFSGPSRNAGPHLRAIPPGLLAKQIEAGSTICISNIAWTVRPCLAGIFVRSGWSGKAMLAGPRPCRIYLIRWRSWFPKTAARITGLADLGGPGVRLAMPEPAFGRVVRQIKLALAKAGGEALTTAVYDTRSGGQQRQS